MALEAMEVAFRSNMHMDIMVIEVADVKFEVKIGLQDYNHCCTLVCGAIAL